MLAHVFPGQGAQKVGMATGLFDLFPEKEVLADSILGYSIRTLCQEDPDHKLNQTEYTQPALYVVNSLLYEKNIMETGRKPDIVAGHSLGEYNALLAAGVFDFETGLRLVQKRGELMSRISGGGMLAIVGLTESSVRKILQDYGLDSIDIANLNTPKQIVLAGPKEDIPAAQAIFEREGAELAMPLRVSGAFHSRYMAGARKEFEAVLSTVAFHRPQITVLYNVTARPSPSEEDIAQLLGEQLTSSVKWTETVQVLLGKGVQEIAEIGPGTVLTKLVSKIREEAQPIRLSDPEHISPAPAEEQGGMVQPEALGNPSFLEDYGTAFTYVAGAMYKGIASEAMVIKLGKSGILSFFGSGGLKRERIEGAIRSIKSELSNGEPFGMNFLHNASNPEAEMELTNLYLEHGIRCIEASAFMGITPALVLFRAKGLHRMADGTLNAPQKIMAKISRPEIAEIFMRPAPKGIVEKLIQENRLTATEAELIGSIPMADDICAEADSGGHTDHAVALTLLPSILELRKDIMNEYKYAKPIRVGAAGGIGTPGAAASMFVIGADFIVTGSINQCTVEAGTSPLVKDMLNQMNVQDTESAPAGDMFEIGARVQVLKKGLFFPARANKLYELYRQFNSLDELDPKTRQQLQERYFKRSFEEVFEEVKTYQPRDEIEQAERNPKHKLALVFKWYFGYSTRAAMQGVQDDKVNFQIHCGPALGAFNQWAKGTALESWRNRHVDEIAIALMKETAALLSNRLLAITAKS
jgi:trans-AT polyketide synthase/acyltransferase/oxidoreductase domain-containing protein